MHTGKSYKLTQFLFWTRRSIGLLLLWGIAVTVLYQVLGWKWLTIPWPVVALLGTAMAFIIGFKNLQTYNRTWEARQIWGAAMSASRAWAFMCRDYINDRGKAREVIYRQLGWLTALRYQLRAPRSWETVSNVHNKEYQKYYKVPEREVPLEDELIKYISKEEMHALNGKNNKAAQLLSMQSAALKKLYDEGHLENFRFLEMHSELREFSGHQGKSERIKNFPYPRQYATINSMFVALFCFLLPIALLGEFNKLNEQVTGVLRGNMVWFVIPFSVLVSWVYVSLEQVGDSTANPFEGSANDVPITQMSRALEIDIREMLGETELPPVIVAENDIVM